MTNRLLNVISKYLIVIWIGCLYFIIISLFNFAVPCIFNQITNLLCPSCGFTRMCKSLANFNLIEAYNYNKYLFINGPIIIFIILYSDIKYIVKNNNSIGKLSIIIYIEIVLAIVFAIIRNII